MWGTIVMNTTLFFCCFSWNLLHIWKKNAFSPFRQAFITLGLRLFPTVATVLLVTARCSGCKLFSFSKTFGKDLSGDTAKGILKFVALLQSFIAALSRPVCTIYLPFLAPTSGKEVGGSSPPPLV